YSLVRVFFVFVAFLIWWQMLFV
ncbi:STAS domain protein, partial [Chlamydia psittaci 84-8471/1]